MTNSREATVHALRFHDDFDGIASAALLLVGLEQKLPDDAKPVSYSHDRASWLATRLPRRTAVVDFLFHPEAAIWFDHHNAPFLDNAPRSGPMQVWVPDAPSCAGVIAKHFSLQGHGAELAFWADKIDSGNWSSPQETLDFGIPAVRIYLSLLGPEFETFAVHLIECLRRGGLAAAAEDSAVISRARAAKRLLDAGMKHLRDNARISHSVASVECALGEAPYVVPRYGIYILFPEAEYMLLNQQQGDGWKLTLSRNPWQRKDGPDIGKLVATLGGGGHRNVGAINVRDRKSAQATEQRLLKDLTSATSSMEGRR